VASSGAAQAARGREELQLATIESARAVFMEQVIDPAVAAPTPLGRLRQLAENFLRYVEVRLYPGGCFFASVAAEMAMRPGPVRDGAVAVIDEFSRQIAAAVRDAQADGEIDPAENAELLAFELNAYLMLANAQFAVSGESAPIERARRALEERIDAAAMDPAERPTARLD
jgi:AcrR family transcriptional regulator